MIPTEQALILLILLIGLIVVLALLAKAGLERIGLPALVGYIVLGLLLHVADQRLQLFSAGEREVLEFLANIGIISLLFRVGLESKLNELVHQLRRASVILLGDILVSGLLGFFTAYGLLKLSLIPSLFVGTAMTATSVGITVSLWREAQAINSPNGELMLDVAEMDDISAVIMMALLLAVAPVLQSNPDATAIAPLLAQTAGTFCLKAIVFGASCFLFSRYVERSLTQFFQRIEAPPDPTIMVTGIGLITAAFAGLLGFSVAIGAFFAGLVFSRDPDAIKLDASFDTFYETFVPFFFVGIGLKVDLSAISAALGLGVILLIVAVLGKMVGVAVPTLMMSGGASAILLGVSMVPRAEITMIVMQHGLQLGDWAVPPQVFSAMVLVSAATTIMVPLVLRPLLQRWPQTSERYL
ncbi:cation:proton antiporter [Vacuolonema iberomarrocanum]|uniref:cation:proton antiporter n=1 Tax=Vacuolonema iberomarrocanum TaxID=3454632 RepID=UPI001A03C692|nr:cation:proton antiporter [filamentous cyanobacterium LEGE 07170]